MEQKRPDKMPVENRLSAAENQLSAVENQNKYQNKATCACLGLVDGSCRLCQYRKAVNGSQRRTVLLPKKLGFQPNPVSKEQGVAAQLVHSLPQLAPHAAWLQYLPPQLGYFPAVDKAAYAFTQALTFYFSSKTDIWSFRAAFLNYGKALWLLRELLRSPDDSLVDQTIICIALIAVFELVMREHSNNRPSMSHWSAMSAIFLARPKTWAASKVAEAIFFTFGGVIFCVPVANGSSSHFADSRWMPFGLRILEDMSDDVAELRNMSHQIRTRRPKIISHMRLLRDGKLSNEDLITTLDLVYEINEFQVPQLESRLLHSVKVRETRDPSSKTITPYSLEFRNSDELVAFIMYCSNRAGVINICLQIIELYPLSKRTFNAEQLQRERERLAINMIMSWEDASSAGPFASVWLGMGYVQIWKELRTLQHFRGIDTARLRAWMLPKLTHPFIDRLGPACSEEDVDAAADFFLFGPTNS